MAGRLSGNRTSVLVGAGVVNLVTAVDLVRNGWRVEIHDASPDPREGAPAGQYGCTWAGGNARMWTATEADCYPGAPFTVPVTDGGWQVGDGAPDPAEQRWLLEHQRFGRAFASEELRSTHLALAPTEDQLAGAVEVEGFTLRVHDLVLGLLERSGVRLRWRPRAHRILWDADGAVAALETAQDRIRADCYVVSPGAYGGELLRGTATDGRIHGVPGVWITLPMPAPPLAISVKIARVGCPLSAGEC